MRPGVNNPRLKMKPKTKRKSATNKTSRHSPVAHQRLVSRRHRVTFYINPDDLDGQQLVMPGLADDAGLIIAAGHFGCGDKPITTRSRMVTEQYLKALPEYDG